MWSGRFRQPLDAEFERWQRSFPFDRRLLEHEVEASRAHARALKNAGIVSPEELASILFGLDQLHEKALSDPSFLQDEEAEDVHHFVEKKLVSLVGDAGYKLHTGRSRNEQVATDLRLYVRAAIDDLQIKLAEFLESFVSCAERAGNAAMPSYTHLQKAEPVLVAHWLLTYVEMFARDGERLADCRKRVNLCPLGSGPVAGATIPLDRNAIAADLGFDAPTANSIDATSDRDFAIEFVTALSSLGLHLSRWAEEMILFSTQEFGFVRLPEAYSTGSSAMPQKKNPDLLELVRGSNLSSLHVLLAPQAQIQVLAAAGMMIQRGVQFHWRNCGYGDFDEFLAALSQDKRKKIRAERRKVREAGVVLERRIGCRRRLSTCIAFKLRSMRKDCGVRFSTPLAS